MRKADAPKAMRMSHKLVGTTHKQKSVRRQVIFGQVRRPKKNRQRAAEGRSTISVQGCGVTA
jgi:hypothetical protein